MKTEAKNSTIDRILFVKFCLVISKLSFQNTGAIVDTLAVSNKSMNHDAMRQEICDTKKCE